MVQACAPAVQAGMEQIWRKKNVYDSPLQKNTPYKLIIESNVNSYKYLSKFWRPDS